MNHPREPEESIPRHEVEQLVENLRHSADDLLDQLAGDEIQVEQILDLTRFMARSARRISRRAHWPANEPAPGNEAGERQSRSPERGRSPDGGRGRSERREPAGRSGGGRSRGRR